MKQLLSSCAIAFSTYSRIPMPQVEWSEKNMRHTLAFFPLVGRRWGRSTGPRPCCAGCWASGTWAGAALLTAVPLVVTGGIHMDGFCDTVDALASHAPREKKLVILKDSAAGAFAVIWCGVWLLACFGLTGELSSVPTLAAGFLLSRALSALAVERLPSARAGMGASLKQGSRFPRWVLGLYLLLYLGLIFLVGGPFRACGPGGGSGVLFLLQAPALRQFGGFTGDLAGWFLQVCELVILAAVVVTERLVALWL